MQKSTKQMMPKIAYDGHYMSRTELVRKRHKVKNETISLAMFKYSKRETNAIFNGERKRIVLIDADHFDAAEILLKDYGINYRLPEVNHEFIESFQSKINKQ